MRFRASTIVILGLLFVAASPGWARKWTDSTGKFSTEAELVEIQGDNVILEKTNCERRLKTQALGRGIACNREGVASLAFPQEGT